MMIEPGTLDKAIGHSAVMLNRMQWLDEGRIDVMHATITTLIDRDGRPGKLVLDDFVTAIVELLESGSSTHDISPATVVASASTIAAARYDEAMAVVHRGARWLLSAESTTYLSGVVPQPEAEAKFRAAAARLSKLVLDSGIDPGMVARVLPVIGKQVSLILSTPRQEYEPLTEAQIAEADAVIALWRSESL